VRSSQLTRLVRGDGTNPRGEARLVGGAQQCIPGHHHLQLHLGRVDLTSDQLDECVGTALIHVSLIAGAGLTGNLVDGLLNLSGPHVRKECPELAHAVLGGTDGDSPFKKRLLASLLGRFGICGDLASPEPLTKLRPGTT
jgi:hypothetical protein